MSAKLMYRFTEENPDLHKRIGCMNGIFQHFVIGRRANQKRLPAVAQSDNGDKQTKGTLQAVKAKNQNKSIKEKQRTSSESSRTSCSSSCSSTFSSIDCNKASQLEVSSIAKTISSETISSNITTKQSGRQDLRDAVKESIKRETCGLSINSIKRDDKNYTFKHIDSPRPMQLSNCIEPNVANISKAKNRRSLAPVDAPRLSYDERESRQKSTIKLKELPRLSLDSRAGSVKSQSSFRNQMDHASSRKPFNPHEERENFNRTSSVVAKLMGLDALPTIVVNDGKLSKPFPEKDLEHFPKSSSVTRNDVYLNRRAGSTRKSEQGDVSPSLRNADLVMKAYSGLRTPKEPFPFKKFDGSKGLPTPVSKHLKTHTLTPDSRSSVYGEIAKRLSELEFRKSGKDLRALQQILETMQKTKEILQNNHDQSPNSEYPSFSSHAQKSKFGNQKSVQNKSLISTKINQTSPRKNSETPIVVMKPATLVRKSSNPASTIIPIEGYPGRLHKLRTHDLTTKENVRVPSNRLHVSTDKNCSYRVKTDQISKVAHQTTVDSPSSSRRISGALSPRLQRRQLILEKQSHPNTTLSESSKPKRQSSRYLIESNSPGRRTRSISPHLQQSDDQLSDTSCITTCSTHQGNAISPESEGTTSFLSRIDADISSTGDSEEIISAFYKQVGKKHQNPVLAKWPEDGSTAKLALTTEQPSPVSVLGAIFYDEDLLSPVKKTTLALEDDGTFSSDESVSTSSALCHISDITESILTFDADHITLENKERSVQHIGQLRSPQVEMCVDWNKNEDHKYIFEILLASGLLSRDLGSLMSTELPAAGNIINPDLFLILEQSMTKELSHNEQTKKLHRKLVFDALNEILVSKVVSQNKLTGRIRNKQPSLKEVCSEIDHLLANNSNGSLEDGDIVSHILQEELKQQSSYWTDWGSDISRLVLDIERSIFRDLVTEVVDVEAASIQARLGRHRRKPSVN